MKNTWDQIPNFDDPYAKIHTRKHSSGAEIIEVIYGAVDSAVLRTGTGTGSH